MAPFLRTLGTAFLASVCLLAQASSTEILVKYRKSESYFLSSFILSAVDAERIDSIPGVGTVRYRVPDEETKEMVLSSLNSMPNIEYAEPNGTLQAFDVPNDPNIGSQWHLNQIHAFQTWSLNKGSSGCVIAIVDTGIQLDHEDLAGKILPGYDFIGNDALADDENGHGTHCAGIAAACTNNNLGVAGVSYNCSLMPVRVLDANGSGTTDTVARGIVFAVDHGAKIVSLSLGSDTSSLTLNDAVQYAYANNVIVCAAAGNLGVNTRMYPAAIDHVLSVGASTQTDGRASFSNYGDWVQVAAPGEYIFSTYKGGQYRYMSGTSMATPVVAGVCALVWDQMGPSAKATDVVNRIEATSVPVGNWVKFGRVDAFGAMNDPDPATFTLALSSSSVSGGKPARLEINLSKVAPVGGLTLAVTSDSNVAIPSASVTVPAGQSTLVVPVATRAVTSDQVATISVATALSNNSIQLSVLAPKLVSARFAGKSMRSGRSSSFTVRLTSPAGADTVVAVAVSSSAISAPATLTIRRGSTVGTITVRANPVNETTPATITASLNGIQKSATLSVRR